MTSASLALLLLAGSLHSATALAAEEEPDKEWREVEAQLPAAPKNENLLPFYQSGSMQFFIDAPLLKYRQRWHGTLHLSRQQQRRCAQCEL